ncbi:hypothetical protein [Rhizobium sp. BK491]|uniref:hypothetical protein n=1 Tax=Rhizobium sp. BK491 TaxID=2587009 RepID=UPI001614A141|nr:hypothetical protein [Rhizobium sp. BK491]MBB3571318.1 hypothetical protein [Rhizobium sp. BK491]
MFISISRFACTQVQDQDGEDENVWPFTFLKPEPVIDDDCTLGEASALLFDRKLPVERVIIEGR